MSLSHRHTQPPTRLNHFTDCGEPMTVIAGIVLERAMMDPHPIAVDATYLNQQIERCCNEHQARIGTSITRAEVLAAAREAVALDAIHPSVRSQAFAAALAGLDS